MTKVTDLQTLRAAHPEMLKEMQQLFAKYGLQMINSRASVGAMEIKFSVRTKIARPVAEQTDLERAEYDRYARGFGLPVDGFGKTFKIGDETYKLVGVQPRSRKNVAKIIRVRDGKQFTCSAQMVRNVA